jgi:alpha-1,3-mannosyltransferase
MPVVTHLVRQFLPNRGGVEDTVLNLGLGLVQLGWDVRIVTLNRLFRAPETQLPDREEISGLQVIRIPFRGSTRYPLAPHALRHIASSDLVHVHSIEFFYDYLALTKPWHRKRLIATTHGGFFHTDFAARLKRVYFATATRASTMAYEQIVASSQQDAKLFGRLTSRVVTIETGVSIDKFSDCAAPEPTRTVIYFGRLSTNKQLPALIGLLAALRKISPDWSLIVAGAEFEESVSALAERARSLGVEKAVRFFPSPTDDDLAHLISTASYFVSLSAYEGFGITAVEAMSAGLVPILSDIPPFREFIRRAQKGLIVNATDLAAAAQAIAAFDATCPTRHRGGFIEAAAKYSWSTMTSAYAAEYGKLLSANAAPRRDARRYGSA